MNFLLGGRLGDTIHVLYVAEHTEGKHDFFITDRRDLHSDGFQNSLQQTIDELMPILSQQPWFNSLNIYGSEPFYENQTGDYVNLSMWRRYVYSDSWTPLLSKTFNVPIVPGPWITLPKITGWEEKVIFHCSVYPARRGHWNIPIDKYNDHRAVFVGTPEEYRLFGYEMEFYQPKDLKEHFDIINSCKYFIGNQSAPLAMAHALDVPRLAILNKADEIAYRGEEKYSKNFSWISDSDFFFEGINF